MNLEYKPSISTRITLENAWICNATKKCEIILILSKSSSGAEDEIRTDEKENPSFAFRKAKNRTLRFGNLNLCENLKQVSDFQSMWPF